MTILDKANNILRAEKQHSAHLECALFNNYGLINETLGDFKKALEHLEAAKKSLE